MLFKDLKSGYPVFSFDRNTMEVKQGKIINVGVPHIDPTYGHPTEMVVDVTAEFDKQTHTYTFKDSAEIGYNGTFVISTGRDAILREVESLKMSAEQSLAQVSQHKTTIEKCSKILEEFNPSFKEKRENEQRLNKLESSLEDIKSMLQNIAKERKEI